MAERTFTLQPQRRSFSASEFSRVKDPAKREHSDAAMELHLVGCVFMVLRTIEPHMAGGKSAISNLVAYFNGQPSLPTSGHSARPAHSYHRRRASDCPAYRGNGPRDRLPGLQGRVHHGYGATGVVKSNFDAVLLDINISGRYQPEIADFLHDKGVPFAFVTGYDYFIVPRHQTVPVLQKPFTAADLRGLLEELVGSGSPTGKIVQTS